MIAQSLAEYGLMAELSGAIQTMSNSVSLWMRDAGLAEWSLVGAIVFGLLWGLRRRR